MNRTPAQQQAITLACNLVVTAGAGSGKTYVLVARYLRLLQERLALSLPEQADAPPDVLPGILAITFTDKAAREMRTRVRDAVEAQARDAENAAERAAWEQQRAAVEAARIGTIHSFCGELLRAQPAESGLDPQFAVLDEVESGWLREAAVDHTLSELAALLDAPASSQQPGVPDAALAHLQALQQEYGLDELRAILVEMLRSGPEARAAVAALPAHPDEMQARWQAWLAQAQAEVFKALLGNAAWRAACTEIVRLAPDASPADRLGSQVAALAAWLAAAGLSEMDTLPDEPPPIPDFTPVLAIDARHGSKKNWPHPEQLGEAREALKALREACKPAAELLNFAPDAALEQRSAQAIAGLCALYRRAQAEYTRRKAEQDALDYDDMLLRARCLLQEHPAVRQRWQAEFHAVLVDEFQDTNDEQRALIYALVGFGQTSPAAESLPALFVVGDGKQSIYRFRGADVSVFRAVADDIQRHAGRSVALDTSFRTHALLVDWVNQVSQAMFTRQRPLHPYETPFEPLHAQRPAPPFHRCVELHIISDAGSADERRAAEAQIIAGRIKALQTGAAGALVYVSEDEGWRVPTYGDIAILCQASSAFEHYEAALQAEGIPYLTTAGRGYFGRQEVQDLIHLLRVLNDTSDELALVGVLRSPLFALDDAAILRLRLAHPRSLWEALHAAPGEDWPTASDTDAAALAFARDTLTRLYAQRGQLTVVELLREALAATGYLATISALPNGAQRRANVEKLIEAARRSGSAGLFTFSAYLENLLKAEPHEGEAPLEAEGSVRLMTIHRSKGLEFPIVVLPDLARTPPNQQQRWLGKPAYGLALRLRDRLGKNQEPLAYCLALREEKLMQQAERERLLYVALTRARDYLILSGPAEKKSGDSWLSRLLAALGYPWEGGGIPGGSHGPLDVWLHAPDAPADPQP